MFFLISVKPNKKKNNSNKRVKSDLNENSGEEKKQTKSKENTALNAVEPKPSANEPPPKDVSNDVITLESANDTQDTVILEENSIEEDKKPDKVQIAEGKWNKYRKQQMLT